MLVTLAAAAVLVSACFFLHLSVMQVLARLIYEHEDQFRHPLLMVIFSLFAAHLIEVVLYAIGLAALEAAGTGSLGGAIVGGPGWFVDHFYFSIASYTTLGIGDIVPSGHIRIIAGIEALNGLVLVAWSASFTYLIMERLWGRKGSKSS